MTGGTAEEPVCKKLGSGRQQGQHAADNDADDFRFSPFADLFTFHSGPLLVL